MAQLSDHTKLMNALIGFTLGVPGWPSFFKDAGYQLDRIEPKFLNSEEDQVNPDILLTSNGSLHALVTECKGGHLNEERLEKYDAITPENLRNEVENVHDVNRLSSENVYVGTEKTEQSFDYLEIPDAGLIFRNSEYNRRNDFEDEDLNNELGGGELPEYYPSQYYPFSPNDSRALIAEKVSQHLMTAASQGGTDHDEFEAADIAKEIHEYWDQISLPGRRELTKKVENILEMLEARNVDDDMRQIEGSRSYYVRTSQAFQRKCQEVIDDLSTDEDLDDFLD